MKIDLKLKVNYYIYKNMIILFWLTLLKIDTK